EDARARGVGGEVGVEAGVLPVGRARQDDPVEVGEHLLERLGGLGRRRRQPRAHLPGLDLRHDAVPLDGRPVVGHPVDDGTPPPPELVGGHVVGGTVGHAGTLATRPRDRPIRPVTDPPADAIVARAGGCPSGWPRPPLAASRGGRATGDAWTGPLGGPGGGAARHGGGVRLDAAVPRLQVVGVQPRPRRASPRTARPSCNRSGRTTSTRTDRRSPVADGCTWRAPRPSSARSPTCSPCGSPTVPRCGPSPVTSAGGGSCGRTRRAPSSPIAARPSTRSTPRPGPRSGN